MSLLEDEIAANYDTFRGDWQAQLQTNWTTLSKENLFYLSYRRLSAVNALKNTIVVTRLSADSAAFFFEAHNDALISHVAASCGSWRPALQSLRSCIENALNAIYFMDHPVELRQWRRGEFKLGFTDLYGYAVKHPAIGTGLREVAGLGILKGEFATLSMAVHASNVDFRMTEPGTSILLWSADTVRARKWATRERMVLEGVALLFSVVFHDELTGAKNLALREALYFAISAGNRAKLKQRLHITLSKP